MKKLFSLFLAFSLLFLTACNTNPPASSDDPSNSNPSSSSSSTEKPQSLLDSIPRDTIIQTMGGDFINLPSRVIFQMYVDIGVYYNVYYSKADGKAYTYCFDPLCNHENEECFAGFFDAFNIGGSALFINNRFYVTDFDLGTIMSFNFDGTDKKIEYEAGFEMEQFSAGAWSPNVKAYGPYIYFDQRADASEDGKKHTLRFNVETKEMEDLTEKTGHYLWPSYFYNDEVYAETEKFEPVKTNLDFTVYEECDTFKNIQYFSGSTTAYYVQDKKYNTLGMSICDIATGEEKQIMNEELGCSEKGFNLIGMDDNYIYFLDAEKAVAGYQLHPRTGKKYAVTKNNGKIYRINHDGTNVVCIYDDPTLDLDWFSSIVFDGNSIIIKAKKYRPVEGDTEGLVETYAGGYYVGKFGEDGMIEELKPIEFVG